MTLGPFGGLQKKGGLKFSQLDIETLVEHPTYN